jgi:hypothetical protein
MLRSSTIRSASAIVSFVTFTLAALAWSGASQAQGCVAARGAGLPASQFGAFSPRDEAEAPEVDKFDVGMGYRWLHSDRHFVGTEEQKQRRTEGSEVINNSTFIDVSLTYAFNPRYSAVLTLPLVNHDRSQVVRANDPQRTILQRFHTQSSGLGDARLVGYMWARSPEARPRANVLLGFGVDAPTGQDDVRDKFLTYNAATHQIVGVRQTVDQSIQPGDGGWGAIFDLYAYAQVGRDATLYFAGTYTVTPQETNGVPTFRSNPFEREMSIGDSYVSRAGVDYVLTPSRRLVVNLGGRIEGVPVHDLVGGSDGFRRPGYAVSVETGLSYTWRDGLSAAFYADRALIRDRQRSVADRRLTESSGIFRAGDAAFADYLFMFNVKKMF